MSTLDYITPAGCSIGGSTTLGANYLDLVVALN